MDATLKPDVKSDGVQHLLRIAAMTQQFSRHSYITVRLFRFSIWPLTCDKQKLLTCYSPQPSVWDLGVAGPDLDVADVAGGAWLAPE